MPRISKAPEIRKQEIMDTAMGLFAQNGYNVTSIADIAKAMNVVPGLIYRYFTSKQELFDVAVKQYAEESGSVFLPVLRDQELPLEEKLNRMMSKMVELEHHSRYSEFYHKPGNQTFHVQLALEMCSFMAPYLEEEVRRMCREGLLTEEHPRMLAGFILHGLLSLWEAPHDSIASFEEQVQITARYIKRLLGIL